MLAEAEARFSALDLAVEQGRTLLYLGRLERRRRRLGAARDVLRAAIELFDRMAAAPWAELARDELVRADGVAAARRGNGNGDLTAAERRLAALVTQGASNQEAAAQLFVSVKTVEATLTRIYRKLGVHSRTQLTNSGIRF